MIFVDIKWLQTQVSLFISYFRNFQSVHNAKLYIKTSRRRSIQPDKPVKMRILGYDEKSNTNTVVRNEANDPKELALRNLQCHLKRISGSVRAK